MNTILDKINNYPVIPVYYHDDSSKCVEILQACYDGGIRVFEFVNRGPKAMENFQILLEYKKRNLPDLFLGIGTIKDREKAKDFIQLGAEFIVSPIIEPSIAQETLEKGILWIPGCMTPSEIAVAEKLGASLIKLFPGDTLTPKFLQAVKPLFPALKFMPTGGVDVAENNIQEWFSAGVFSVGLGSKLFQAPENATDFTWLAQRCQLVLSWIK